MIELDLGSSSLKSDRITTVKIDVTRMVEPNSQERVRDTDTEWVDVLVNTFKNRLSSVHFSCGDVLDPSLFHLRRRESLTEDADGGKVDKSSVHDSCVARSP